MLVKSVGVICLLNCDKRKIELPLIDGKDVLGIQNDEPQSIYKASAGHQTQEYQGNVSVGKLEV